MIPAGSLQELAVVTIACDAEAEALVGNVALAINKASPAQLTSSLEQGESWWDAKNSEKPHEINRVPVSSLKPGQATARQFGEGIDWYRLHHSIPESQVEVVVPHQVPE